MTSMHLTALHLSTRNADGSFDLHAVHEGDEVLLRFEGSMAQSFLTTLKPHIDAIWNAREMESMMGDAPSPGPYEEALDLRVGVERLFEDNPIYRVIDIEWIYNENSYSF